MTPIQRATRRCDSCGRVIAVVPTDSPHDFTYRCACGNAGIVAWDGDHPPPVFEAPAVQQAELFR